MTKEEKKKIYGNTCPVLVKVNGESKLYFLTYEERLKLLDLGIEYRVLNV